MAGIGKKARQDGRLIHISKQKWLKVIPGKKTTYLWAFL